MSRDRHGEMVELVEQMLELHKQLPMRRKGTDGGRLSAVSRKSYALSIRPVRVHDIGTIAKMAEQVARTVRKERGWLTRGSAEFKHKRGHYQKLLKAKDCRLLVAEVKGEVAGYVLACAETVPDDLITVPYVEVVELAVDPARRRTGIATALLEAVHQWALDAGVRVVQLATWEFNRAALACYEQAGYRTIMRKMERILRP